MLNAASKLKGEKDWQKYETARKLHKYVDCIRDSYRTDWKSKEMRIRQRGVALYFIDKVSCFFAETLENFQPPFKKKVLMFRMMHFMIWRLVARTY